MTHFDDQILVINQPSRIIITNIHANPGIPIQNQPTGVPSLVPNQRAEKIENYAVLSIFSLICCCFPIGLLASLMSFQVNKDRTDPANGLRRTNQCYFRLQFINIRVKFSKHDSLQTKQENWQLSEYLLDR